MKKPPSIRFAIKSTNWTRWDADLTLTANPIEDLTGTSDHLLGPGSHGTTFGGTPLVSVGANEVLSVIEEEGMLENARTLGAHALTHAWTARIPALRAAVRDAICRQILGARTQCTE